MNHIKETIAELERELEKLRIDIASIERVLGILKDKSPPKPDQNPKPMAKASPIKKPQRTKRKTTKKSKYKGVVIMERPDGTCRYRANYWDAARKKTKNQGTYDTELLAAAAVQKALGNDKEAEKLSHKAMKESDTSTSQMTLAKTSTKERYFKCKHCKLETKTKPIQCMNCNSASFDGPLTRELKD